MGSVGPGWGRGVGSVGPGWGRGIGSVGPECGRGVRSVGPWIWTRGRVCRAMDVDEG